MSKLYAVIGCYGIGFGLYSVPTALFVNLHFLLISVAHVLLGMLCLSIARGLAQGKLWARWGGVFVSLGILSVFLVGLVQTVQEGDASGVIFFALASSYMLAVLLVTLKSDQPDPVRTE
jgi:hypothetical protein